NALPPLQPGLAGHAMHYPGRPVWTWPFRSLHLQGGAEIGKPFREDGLDDPLGGAPIAERICRMSRGEPSFLAVENCRDRRDDAVGIGPNEARWARLDRLAPLGDIPHDQHGFTEAGRLFLNAARIREDQAGAHHEVDEGAVVGGPDQMDIGPSTEALHDWNPHLRIGMHREHDRHIASFAQPEHRAADLLDAFAHILDRKSTRLNSSHVKISYAVFCLKK